MQISSYLRVFNEYFASPEYSNHAQKAKDLLRLTGRVFFLGNGGSNAICSHMYEDFAKILRYQTFAFSDAALITCFSNDYGYEQAMAEWLGIYGQEGDVLVAISSSGNSMNIVNAARRAKSLGMSLITLSGFKPENNLRALGDVNFYIGVSDYGIVECFHQVILHAILDDLAMERKR
jgi:D-sedoheptulose 7-phosphate isomerase